MGQWEGKGYYDKTYSDSIKKENVWCKAEGQVSLYYYYFCVGDHGPSKAGTNFSNEWESHQQPHYNPKAYLDSYILWKTLWSLYKSLWISPLLSMPPAKAILRDQRVTLLLRKRPLPYLDTTYKSKIINSLRNNSTFST